MNERPNLTKELKVETFLNYYYLKEELINFCKEYNLPSSGSKIELTNRIAYFLKTGLIQKPERKKTIKQHHQDITEDSLIEPNFVYSEENRAFFVSKIGKSFSFNVLFQKWLKTNAGKTYKDAINAYYEILNTKKKTNTPIDKQFEYNTYIRDFFKENHNKTLADAIICWKYKKSLPGHNRYEPSDLKVLD